MTTNIQTIAKFTDLVSNNVREAYSFMSDNPAYVDIGADFSLGKKFAKIIINTGQKSVHAFVDLVTLDVYKAATWNAPAKGVRFNLNNDMDKLEKILSNKSAYCGGYLYK